MSLSSTMKFSTCDIYNMFCAVLIQYFTHKIYVNFIQYDHLITVETIV